jgi:hypothetical protein
MNYPRYEKTLEREPMISLPLDATRGDYTARKRTRYSMPKSRARVEQRVDIRSRAGAFSTER